MKLIKGLFLRRPTVRSLAPPWNLTRVLEALAKPPFEPLHAASLKHVTIKTAFLLSAASARRRGAIHALSVKDSHLRFENEGVRLIPDPQFLAKNQTLEFLPQPIFLPKITTVGTEADRVWCPVRALRYYIKATQPFRGHHTRLFLSTVSPHTPVSRDTLSRWLVTAIRLDDSSLGSACIKAHQIRGVASSLALYKGVDIREIMSAAVWKSPSTFTSTYLLDMSASEGPVARAVLGRGGATSSSW